MRSGLLRHVIDIQDAAETPDGMGGFTTSYSDLHSNLRAAIWPLSGSERLESDKLELSVTHRIRIRYREGIKADMRVSFDSRYFNIKSVIVPDERRIMVEMLCEEIDGGS
jgi:SPP1 family predicted phage head-tail adaptor